MSAEDLDKPNRQVEPIELELGKGVKDTVRDNKPTWMLCRELGRGAFGTVYHVVNEATRQEAALKVETIATGDNLLKIEREIMIAMRHEPTAMQIFDDGLYNDYRFIVMTLCGPDLEKLADLMNNKFSPETVIRVSIRTLLAIKTLHEYEYVHRDLKPCNFALAYLPNSPHVHLFDYGMARKYARRDGSGYSLRRPREHSQFRGTVRYCSLSMHNRKDMGRVDDIWSWLFMLIEMHTPLPWAQTAIPERCEYLKTEPLFAEFMAKHPFLHFLQPLVKLLATWDFYDRPDYSKILEMLLTKLRELHGKLSGANEFDKRIAAYQSEQEKNAAYKTEATREPPPAPRGEDEELKYLTAAFAKVVIPGGAKYALAEGVDFFGTLYRPTPELTKPAVVEVKEKREERTDEGKKKKAAPAKTTPSVPARNKLIGMFRAKTPAPATNMSGSKALTGRKSTAASFSRNAHN